MDEITIIPLFNQDPVIWNNFLSVRCDAIRGAYNQELTSGECDFMLENLANAWHRRAHNFAYAAYHDKTMVGFVQGDCMSNIATMRSLYVRPEYQKCGIGRQLLQKAERTAGLGAHNIDLVAMFGAMNFYQECGYSPLIINGQRINRFQKEINCLPHCATLPAFCATPDIKKACNKIAKDNKKIFNPDDIKTAHKPAYVYLNYDGTITAYGVDGDILVAAYECKPFLTHRIQRAFQEYNNNLGKIR